MQTTKFCSICTNMKVCLGQMTLYHVYLHCTHICLLIWPIHEIYVSLGLTYRFLFKGQHSCVEVTEKHLSLCRVAFYYYVTLSIRQLKRVSTEQACDLSHRHIVESLWQISSCNMYVYNVHGSRTSCISLADFWAISPLQHSCIRGI